MIRQTTPKYKANKPLVSLCIVNYKTELQTRLCLRSIRKFTRVPYEVIVVDNGSDDDSLRYLQSLNWIRCLSNPTTEPTHRNGLEFARQHCSGEWIAILHSDTFPRTPNWLAQLLSLAPSHARVIASQDRVILPLDSIWSRLNLWWKRRKRTKRWLTLNQQAGRDPHAPAKLMSHCALFHQSIFEHFPKGFDSPRQVGELIFDCAEHIQRAFEANTNDLITSDNFCWVTHEQLAPLFFHFEGATLNLVTGRKLAKKRLRRAEAFYRRPEIQALLNDAELDI